jgi:hypothetical protein
LAQRPTGGAGLPPDPQTLRDAAQVAVGLGLYYRSNRSDGVLIDRLVVSVNPLTYERANTLRINDPDLPCWAGTIAVCTDPDQFGYLEDHRHGARWGGLFVYGDPALVRKLTTSTGPLAR